MSLLYLAAIIPARAALSSSGSLDLDAEDAIAGRDLARDVEAQRDGGEVVVDGLGVAAGPRRLEDEELGAADSIPRKAGHPHRPGHPFVTGRRGLRRQRIPRTPATVVQRVPGLDDPVLAAEEGQPVEV